MQAGAAEGMCTMDGSLLKLVRKARSPKETALVSCVHYENMSKRLGTLTLRSPGQTLSASRIIKDVTGDGAENG